MKNFLIAYDIFDNKRLSHIRKIVYSYALSGQKSALEAPLCHTLLKSMLQELEHYIKDIDMLNIIHFIGEPILLGKGLYESYSNKAVIII